MIKLNSEEIEKYEKIQKNKIKQCNINSAYVLGKNPTIFQDTSKKKPDNRIPVPLAKSAVEDMTGFAASVGNIITDFHKSVDETSIEENERNEYKIINKEIYHHNSGDIETTELYSQALTQGESYELFWVSDELNFDNGIVTPEFTMVENKEIVLVYSNSIKSTLVAAIRYWVAGNVKYADVYYPKHMESWKRVIEKNKETTWVRNKESDTSYPYTSVPLAVYKINRHSQPLFEAEKEMIDAHDNLISKSVNEIDRFNALLALFPDTIDEDFINKMEEYKVIDNLGEYDRWPEYLEKNLEKINSFYSGLADRLERYIHKTMKIPDFSDENFAGNSSGVAIRFKLMGMEFKAAQIDAYFNKGLIQRNKLINEVLNSGTKKWNNYRLEIDNKRNIPIDSESKAEVALKLMGIVSRETLLKYLPSDIIEDVELELKLLQKELIDGLPEDE